MTSVPTTSTAEPARLRWHAVVLVAVGGTLGAGAREALTLALPRVDGINLTVLGINVVGAFLLGLLVEAVTRGGVPHSRRTRVQLVAGTGFCGGFTTYSALAVDTVLLTDAGCPGVALGYAGATVVVGALATWAGLVVGARTRPRRGEETA